jgi:hypothetical protein
METKKWTKVSSGCSCEHLPPQDRLPPASGAPPHPKQCSFDCAASVNGKPKYDAPSLQIGARRSAVTWGRPGASNLSDDGARLMVFGGYGWNSSSVGYLSDLWQWSSAGGWTFVAGPQTVDTVSSTTMWPSARSDAAHWAVQTGSTHVWMFGGASVNGTLLNDVRISNSVVVALSMSLLLLYFRCGALMELVGILSEALCPDQQAMASSAPCLRRTGRALGRPPHSGWTNKVGS